jgi:phosphoglycolate phosphatase
VPIVFDFDGTLADTLDAVHQLVGQYASRRGYRVPDVNALRQSGSVSWKGLLSQAGIPQMELAALGAFVRKELGAHMETIAFLPGVEPALRRLRDEGHSLGVVTSNSRQNVRRFLKARGWLEDFDFVYSGRSLFGKAAVLRRMLRAQGLGPADVVYVGDEVRDVEACRKAGLRVIAVTWGMHCADALSKSAPDAVVSHPDELAGAASLCEGVL